MPSGRTTTHTDLDLSDPPDPGGSTARAAQWAFAWAALFVALHVYWAFGGRIGFGDAADPMPDAPSSVSGWIFNVIVVGMFALGLAVPLALARPWRRRLPRRLVVTLMWAGALILTARGGAGLLDGVLRLTGVSEYGLTGLTYEQSIGTAHPSAYTLLSLSTIDAYFLAGGLLFGWAAHRARHQPKGTRC